MRAFLIAVVVLRGVAAAEPHFGEPIEGDLSAVAFVPGPPAELARSIPPQQLVARVAMLERAESTTKHPRVRANLLLLRADLLALHGLRQREAGILDDDRASAHAGDQLLNHAVRVYQRLYCAPGDTQRGFACARDPELVGWPNLDDALHHVAFVLDTQRAKDRILVHQRLVADHPASPHVAYSRLAIAEHEAATGNHDRAHAQLDLVATSASPHATYALYQRGVVELALKRPAVAFATFEQALARDHDKLLGRGVRDGLALAFSRFGKPADAHATFARLAPDHAFEMLGELAVHWFEVGKLADAIAIFREQLRRKPTDENACAWHASIARSYHDLHDGPNALAATEQLVRHLVRVRGGAPDSGTCHNTVRHLTLEMARAYASKILPDQLVVADRLFELFLHTFPDDAEAAAARVDRAAVRRSLRR